MIALRMRRSIEASSGFIIDRRDLGGPRSQRGVRKISLEVFFRTDVIDRRSLLSCRDSNPSSISMPSQAGRDFPVGMVGPEPSAQVFSRLFLF
jgi:hypothetical protein